MRTIKKHFTIFSLKTGLKPVWSWKAGKSKQSAPRAYSLKRVISIGKKTRFIWSAAILRLCPTASTHIKPDAVRPRKLLLNQSEINKLIGKTERAGYTIVPLDLHFSRGKIKMEIGLAKGKKQHDKRQSMKEADWKREKQRLIKHTR
uniref:SsrA-binding protein n=1 Tax=Neisseria meningitidis alpha275 TaxID=295996 RepID=C6SHY7_NEIME|nr:SsrA-binding protein [Neisseria meningitidis alpha275]